MIKTSRELTNFEKFFVHTKEKIQFAVEVNEADFVPKIIRNFQHYVPGFHLRLEDYKYFCHNKPIQIYSIPKNITTAREACDFIQKIEYDYKDTLSIIGANDKTVAVSVSHSICDAGFFSEIISRLLHDIQYNIPSPIPIPTDEIFSNELAKITNKDIEIANSTMNNLTTLRWSKNYQDLQTKNKPGMPSIIHTDESLLTDFQFTKSKVNATDLYMVNSLLSIMSINGRIDSKFGLNVPVNLRQFLPSCSINLSSTQNISAVNVLSHHITADMTLKKLCNILREDLRKKLLNGSMFAVFRGYMENGINFDRKKCCFLEFSNIGKIGSLKNGCVSSNGNAITDLWIQQSLPLQQDESSVYLMSFVRMKHGAETVVSRFRQPNSVINNEDAETLFASIIHLMKEAPVNAPIQSVYDELRSFQSRFKKEKKAQ